MSMKKILQIPLLLVALFLTSIPISAHDFEVDGIYYNVIDEAAKTVEVTYRGNYSSAYDNEYTGSVTIPDSVTYSGTYYSVISIGSSAFYGCTGLTSITIPNSVTTIAYQAFLGCPNLESIEVESGNSIYDSRDNCNAIIETKSNTLIFGCASTIIPSSVKSIGDGAFAGCSNLTSITLPEYLYDMGDYVFTGCNSLSEINGKPLSYAS